MGWFEIHGWDVGIQKANDSEAEQGSLGRAFSGDFIDSRRENYLESKMSTSPLTEPDARTVFYLLKGRGETWSFDATSNEEFGSRGTGVEGGSTWTRVVTSPTPKFGVGCLDILSGDTWTPSYTLPEHWTICGWKYDGGWKSFALRSDGDFFDDGDKNTGDDPTDFMDAVTGSKPVFHGKTGGGVAADTNYDHIRILPYKASDNFLASIGYSEPEPIGGLPFITVGGDFLDSEETVLKKVIGVKVNKKRLQSNVGGTFNHVGSTVDFEIAES